MLVFPTCFFGIYAKDVDIELAKMSGGVALNGEEDEIATDGGGRWFAEMGDVALTSRDKIMAWRAFKAATGGCVDPFIFPICDARHQPTAGKSRVPHADGASFDDDTLYSQGDGAAQLTADAALRATTISISLALAKPLVGGERFTLVHPNMRERAYVVGRISEQTASSATFQFHPPLREAAAAGTVVDFNDPRFVATVQGPMRAPLANPKFARGAVRFVEDFRGSYA
ncbi:MAG: hypothetical protein VX569_11040 [Pseudomonadota bacterium]|nr:hypothetical protein [Pseudomonadota bacterium]